MSHLYSFRHTYATEQWKKGTTIDRFKVVANKDMRISNIVENLIR
jgi:hypothetical protein